MPIKCVVVANQIRARIFIQQDPGTPLMELADIDYREAGLQGGNTAAHKPAGSFDNKDSSRHAMQPEAGTGERSEICFAKSICEFLEEHRNRYDKLILIAPPEFLGVLRKCLPGSLPRLLINTVNKDIVRKNPDEIQRLLKL